VRSASSPWARRRSFRLPVTLLFSTPNLRRRRADCDGLPFRARRGCVRARCAPLPVSGCGGVRPIALERLRRPAAKASLCLTAASHDEGLFRTGKPADDDTSLVSSVDSQKSLHDEVAQLRARDAVERRTAADLLAMETDLLGFRSGTPGARGPGRRGGGRRSVRKNPPVGGRSNVPGVAAPTPEGVPFYSGARRP
jgi:hypothetical protein